MSDEKDEERALQEGRASAIAALTAMKARVATLSERERMFWWCGFLATGMGAAVASLGSAAARPLRVALAGSQEQPGPGQHGAYPKKRRTHLRKRRTYLKK
jgi:hypothetical protein